MRRAGDLHSEEHHDLAQVSRFRFSVELFHRNYDEFSTFTDYFCAPPVAFSYSWTNEHWLWFEGIREVSCLLHNFVASAHSLVDHSRVLYRTLYEPAEVLVDYPLEIRSRFANDPLSQFVVKLRQMAQHYRLPTIGSHLSLTMAPDGRATNTSLRLLLRRVDLEEFDGWTKPAKRFIEEAGSDIDLREVIARYHRHVDSFQRWFSAQQRVVHGPALEEYQFVVRHGTRSMHQEVQEFERRIDNLLESSIEDLTFRDLEAAFEPVVTVLDARRLHLCRYDPGLWIRRALSAVVGRFTLPRGLEARVETFASKFEREE